MRSKFFILFILIVFCYFKSVSGQNLQQDKILSIISAFRSYKEIKNIQLKVPTVVEVPFDNEFIERFDFAVFDETTNSFEPYYFKQETFVNEIPISINTIPFNEEANKMIDKDTTTYTEFLLPDNYQGQAQINLESETPITSSELNLVLDQNVALPTSIEIRAFVNGQDKIIVAKQTMAQTTIYFPQTKSDKWQITFFYNQPLRISEIRLNQDNATKITSNAIRFLAQPKHSYRIYFNPDRSVNVLVGEASNLELTEGLIILPNIKSLNNSSYRPSDMDNDGIIDVHDNCISVYNSDQKDIDNNGLGDACDDWDKDGVINSQDNCPNNPNQDQIDTDDDGVGDICDKEENRITERYSWLPWFGIGFAVVVLVVLFIFTLKTKDIKEKNNIDQENN
ncbi:MAG: hypothetical protein KatS3mg094_150 [Candidatus Parcubacteria bacterium]|nr:MAG: hypothetical protein KatS3mg094_150 [Candidatus Parcubacteria bacterium]